VVLSLRIRVVGASKWRCHFRRAMASRHGAAETHEVPLAPFGAKLADCFGAMASAMARRKLTIRHLYFFLNFFY